MMQKVIEEAKQALSEMLEFAVVAIPMVVFGLGTHAAVFYEADGEKLRLTAGVNDSNRPNDANEARDLISKTRTRLECTEKIPGFTVIVGMSHYSLELSVPVRGMQTFDDGGHDVARVQSMADLKHAA